MSAPGPLRQRAGGWRDFDVDRALPRWLLVRVDDPGALVRALALPGV